MVTDTRPPALPRFNTGIIQALEHGVEKNLLSRAVVTPVEGETLLKLLQNPTTSGQMQLKDYPRRCSGGGVMDPTGT